MIFRTHESSEEVYVSQDWYVDFRIFCDRSRHIESCRVIVDHKRVGSAVQSSHRIVADFVRTVCDVDSVQCVFTGFFISFLFGFHEEFDSFLERAVVSVGNEELVIFDDIASSAGCLIEELGSFFRRPADIWLDHCIEERSVIYAEQIPESLDTEFGALVFFEICFREHEVYELDLACGSDISEDSRHEHRVALSDVLHRERHLDYYISAAGIREIGIRYFIYSNKVSSEILCDLAGLAYGRDPCSGGLFVSQGFCEKHDVLGCRENLECRDDVVIVENHFGV